jgi:multicomponent Na+:H+ antiporter subunit E
MKYFFVFILLTSFWLLMSGIYKPLMLAFCLLSVTLVMLINRRMNLKDLSPVLFELNFLRTFKYCFWLFYEIFKANVEVTKIVLDWRSKVNSKFINLPLNQRTDLGQVIFANSITLTPGTVAIEMEQDTVMVHALNVTGESENELIKMGKNVEKIER